MWQVHTDYLISSLPKIGFVLRPTRSTRRLLFTFAFPKLEPITKGQLKITMLSGITKVIRTEVIRVVSMLHYKIEPVDTIMHTNIDGIIVDEEFDENPIRTCVARLRDLVSLQQSTLKKEYESLAIPKNVEREVLARRKLLQKISKKTVIV